MSIVFWSLLGAFCTTTLSLDELYFSLFRSFSLNWSNKKISESEFTFENQLSKRNNSHFLIISCSILNNNQRLKGRFLSLHSTVQRAPSATWKVTNVPAKIKMTFCSAKRLLKDLTALRLTKDSIIDTREVLSVMVSKKFQ